MRNIQNRIQLCDGIRSKGGSWILTPCLKCIGKKQKINQNYILFILAQIYWATNAETTSILLSRARSTIWIAGTNNSQTGATRKTRRVLLPNARSEIWIAGANNAKTGQTRRIPLSRTRGTIWAPSANNATANSKYIFATTGKTRRILLPRARGSIWTTQTNNSKTNSKHISTTNHTTGM